MGNGKKLFVTKIKETTRFEKIVKRITTDVSILKLLFKLGFDFLQIQIGTGLLQVSISADSKHAICKKNNSTTVKFRGGLNLTLKYNHSFEEFDEEIKKADLVISDADLGSCVAVLKRNKPLLVVITQDMMDTRKLQNELAEQLQKNGHLNYCTVDNLEEGLTTAFKAYSKADKNLFAKYLGKCLGFFNK
ncbi:UDP-N-acetylglucosamine transferase subunit ALG13 homolog [Sitophilus oryzae]|uniref:UDP-N-acetylglucosamine transferase subunit ALG13 n=1 Tax=Sitophilus oryzae TaxID=7048 RepID=A0A6J2YEC8_SITOR|nr:UDP-N-acetylglucosamine transferase subunit ALG13 homolog [Sitophilus oryzae]